jgi:glycosyltransferase involved in cell wall biosynthesis
MSADNGTPGRDVTVSLAQPQVALIRRRRSRPIDLRPVDDLQLITDPIVSAVPVSVVIPTLNEALNLPHVLARIPNEIAELIIVDGHSTDGTTELARELWPGVRIVNQSGSGKGNALAAGFWAATGDIIVMLDADGSTDPAEIPRFVATLLTGADFAKGTRFVTGGGSSDITRIRRLGNRFLSTLVNRIWSVDYSDLCYGYNAFWRRHLPDIVPDCAGFEVETLINIRVARSRLRIVEVPSFESNRLHGVSNLHARRDGMRVLRTILAERVRPT